MLLLSYRKLHSGIGLPDLTGIVKKYEIYKIHVIIFNTCFVYIYIYIFNYNSYLFRPGLSLSQLPFLVNSTVES